MVDSTEVTQVLKWSAAAVLVNGSIRSPGLSGSVFSSLASLLSLTNQNNAVISAIKSARFPPLGLMHSGIAILWMVKLESSEFGSMSSGSDLITGDGDARERYLESNCWFWETASRSIEEAVIDLWVETREAEAIDGCEVA